MKTLECEICEEEYEVDDKVKKVVCAECLITEEAPLHEGKVHGYSNEAFLKLVSVGIDNWEIFKDKEAEEKKLIEKFNKLREKEIDLVNIKRKLNISWREVKKLEGYRLLKKGWSQKDIVKELQISPSTIYRWKTLQNYHKDEVLHTEEEKMHDSDFESVSSSISSGAKNAKFEERGNSKIKYNFSPKTLKIVKEETDEIPELENKEKLLKK